MRRPCFYLFCYAVNKRATRRKGLSTCRLQSYILRYPGFTTRMEDMRFTGIPYSSRGSALLPVHSALLLSYRVQRAGRLNSIVTITVKHLSSRTWAVIENVIWRKTCVATRQLRLLSRRYFLSTNSRHTFL